MTLFENLNPQLQEQIKTALEEMNNHPDHRLSPARRREIYVVFGPKDDQITQKARGWLGVLAAQRVLPLFYEIYPNDELPQEILDTALGVLQGHVDEERAYDVTDHAYHASGNYWGYERDITIDVHMAATASYHALKEARGFEPLTHLQNYSSLGAVTMPDNWAVLMEDPFRTEVARLTTEPDMTQEKMEAELQKLMYEHGIQFAQVPEPVTGDKWDDEDVGDVVDGDAAAAAAVAMAYNTPNKELDPQKFQEFWIWWLTEAIPMAWEAARNNQLPDQKG